VASEPGKGIRFYPFEGFLSKKKEKKDQKRLKNLVKEGENPV